MCSASLLKTLKSAVDNLGRASASALRGAADFEHDAESKSGVNASDAMVYGVVAVVENEELNGEKEAVACCLKCLVLAALMKDLVICAFGWTF